MSLLLEALKRAERQRHPADEALPPIPASAELTPDKTFTEQLLTLEPLSVTVAAGATVPLSNSPSATLSAEQREQARSMLGATCGRRQLSLLGKRQLILGGIVLVLAASAAGTLFWLERQLLPPQPLQTTAALLPAAESATPPVREDAPTPMSTPTASTIPPPERQAAREENAGPASFAGKPVRALTGTAPTAPRAPATNAPAIRRSEAIITIDKATAAGYAAMASGKLDAAREHYREALKGDQRSRHALLGLAVTALREGRADDAVRRYEQMLALDPRDADANAGMALLRGAMDPVAHESRLQALLAEQGDNAALHHALGSLLARQYRWGEAQEVLFRAVTLAPLAADYQFNLAVSLEHLGQYVQARTYYRKALALSAEGAASFSREAVQSRIAAIDAFIP